MILEGIQKLQEELSQKVITKNILPTKIEKICGIDVAYTKDKAYCSAVIVNRKTLKILESKNFSCKISNPYIPSFFMLREGKPILQTLKKLENSLDVLLVDVHGQIHPRKCGLACFVGLKLDKPVVGIAKKLLCGKILPTGKIELNGKIVGYRIQNKKDVFVSIGNKISLPIAIKLVKELTRKEIGILNRYGLQI